MNEPAVYTYKDAYIETQKHVKEIMSATDFIVDKAFKLCGIAPESPPKVDPIQPRESEGSIAA